MKKIVSYTVLILFFAVSAYGNGDIKSVDAKKLVEISKVKDLNDFIIIDIRGTKNHNKARIPGSILIPFESLKTTHRVTSSDKKIIVYGNDIKSSIKAVDILRKRGIDALYIDNGLEGWKKAGGSVEEGETYIKGLPDRFTIPRGLCVPLEPALKYGDDNNNK